jgi:hypothetical protein
MLYSVQHAEVTEKDTGCPPDSQDPNQADRSAFSELMTR